MDRYLLLPNTKFPGDLDIYQVELGEIVDRAVAVRVGSNSEPASCWVLASELEEHQGNVFETPKYRNPQAAAEHRLGS